jgi:hypothetical protein
MTIANTPALAAALEPWYPVSATWMDRPDWDDLKAANCAQLADAALRWVYARLSDPAAVEAVARALVVATEDDCDGYLPLTAVDIDTLSVTRMEDAAVALDAVRALLMGGGE